MYGILLIPLSAGIYDRLGRRVALQTASIKGGLAMASATHQTTSASVDDADERARTVGGCTAADQTFVPTRTR